MIDLVLATIVLVSALLGLLRGFTAIVVATASWLLAAWAAFKFGHAASLEMAGDHAPSMTDYVGGYALTFVGVLLCAMLLGLLLKAGVRASALSGVDRLAGLVLGLVRGGVFACVLLLLLGFTPLTGEAAWRDARLRPLLQPGADWMRAQLPEMELPRLPELDPAALRRLDLTRLPTTGDNAALQNITDQATAQLPQLGQAVSAALGRKSAAPAGAAPVDPARVLPRQVDPAEVRADSSDPARVVPPGQARPR
ncbi:MAG: CvpA family protein [Pseudoxanthomonas sp.]